MVPLLQIVAKNYYKLHQNLTNHKSQRLNFPQVIDNYYRLC